MAVVARTYRGALRDLEHHGRIVVADAAGNVLYHYGDPYAITFARSAAKPMQAIAVCESGALEAYGVTEQELAVMCASHNGEPARWRWWNVFSAKRGWIHRICSAEMPIQFQKRASERCSAAGFRPMRFTVIAPANMPECC